MEIINVNLAPMEKVEVLGISALFTPNKVSRSTLHLNLFCYELQEKRSQTEHTWIICQEISTHFYGTILTPVPMLVEGMEQLEIDANDLVFSNQTYTPAQFEALYHG